MWCYTYGMISTEDVEKMAKAGIPIVNLDLYMQKLDADVMQNNCDIIGTIFDNKTVSDKLSEFYAEQVEKVSSKLSQVPAEKYTFYYETLVYLESYNSGGTTDNTEFLNQKSATTYGTTISAEAFASGNISFVFLDAMRSYAECGANIGWGATVTQDDIDSIAASLSKRTGWNEAPAVKNNDVYIVDMMTMGSTFDCWFIYQYIAEKMFPEVYGDLGYLESLEGYYEEFLPWIDFKGVWCFSLDGEIVASDCYSMQTS